MKTKRDSISNHDTNVSHDAIDHDKILNADEKAYLRKFIAEHLEFYRTVAGSSDCTPGNRKVFELVKGLWQKLQ